MMTENEFEKWIIDKTQRRIVYFTGVLASARDRCKPDMSQSPQTVALNHIANTLYEMAQQGQVVLAQKRLKANRYEYIAWKTEAF